MVAWMAGMFYLPRLYVYHCDTRPGTVESERFKRFAYDELVARDKKNLDILWLKDDSIEDAADLPAPEVIAREIIEELQSALAEIEAIAEALRSLASDRALQNDLRTRGLARARQFSWTSAAEATWRVYEELF